MAETARTIEEDPKTFLFDLRDIRPIGRGSGETEATVPRDPNLGLKVGVKCKCCELPDQKRHQLHLDLLSGCSIRDVAGRFQILKSSVHRHLVNHLWPEVVRLIGDEGILIGGDNMDAETVIHDLGRARRRALEISEDEEAERRDQLGGLKVLHSISRTGLELTGHLKRGADVNVTTINASAIEGQVQPVIDQIMTALADHPEAALAVVNALSSREVVEAKALPAAE